MVRSGLPKSTYVGPLSRNLTNTTYIVKPNILEYLAIVKPYMQPLIHPQQPAHEALFSCAFSEGAFRCRDMSSCLYDIMQLVLTQSGCLLLSAVVVYTKKTNLSTNTRMTVMDAYVPIKHYSQPASFVHDTAECVATTLTRYIYVYTHNFFIHIMRPR